MIANKEAIMETTEMACKAKNLFAKFFHSETRSSELALKYAQEATKEETNDKIILKWPN